MTSFPLLRKGGSGIFVKYLQYGLHIMCWSSKPFDGIFGEGTKTAVINFQNTFSYCSSLKCVDIDGENSKTAKAQRPLGGGTSRWGASGVTMTVAKYRCKVQ